MIILQEKALFQPLRQPPPSSRHLLPPLIQPFPLKTNPYPAKPLYFSLPFHCPNRMPIVKYLFEVDGQNKPNRYKGGNKYNKQPEERQSELIYLLLKKYFGKRPVIIL